MKGINLFLYSLKQGFINLRKNRMFTLASVGTVAACLFLFGLFYFALSNFQSIIHSAENSVGISVFFDENITEPGIQMIGDAIRIREEVDKINYVSAEEAWQRFKEENFADSPDLIESFGEDNPLADSASYEIYLKDIEKQETLVEYLKTVEGIRDIKKSDDVAIGLSSISKLVGIVSVVLITVLLLVSVFLIHSTIATGIVVRRQEISIMRLMGAADFFIWAPFIVEGIVIGLVGALLPLSVLSLAYGRMIQYINTHFSLFSRGLSFLSTGQVFSVLIPISLLVGIGIGFVGSFVTVRRNLNF